MQRWLSTPPEDEGFLPSTIVAAVGRRGQQVQKRKADSTCAMDTFDSTFDALQPFMETYDPIVDTLTFFPDDRGYDTMSMSGVSSGHSANSYGSHVSHGSWAGRKGRKRSKIGNQGYMQPSKKQQVVYQCTWCRQGFGRKDSWKRLEESEHCPQKEYVCMLNGPKYTDPSFRDLILCVFCGSPDSSEDHLRGYRAQECYTKPEIERSFARPDNLVQHIRQIHNPVRVFSYKDHNWVRPIQPPGAQWLCGFCSMPFTDWNSRATHIAAHFCSGDDMSSWILLDTVRPSPSACVPKENLNRNMKSFKSTQDDPDKKGQRFVCTEFPPCNLSFTRSEHLTRHIRYLKAPFFFFKLVSKYTYRGHTGPLQCRHCGKRFSQLHHLSRHVQGVHVNEEIPTDSLDTTGIRLRQALYAQCPHK